MKKITIMIPTYNQAKYIEKAIESALSIDYQNLEVIVSDDCSTDNTKEVVSKYLADKRFQYIKNEKNLGRVGNYRKTLYEYATGDYILNLDGDDWLLESDFFSEALKVLDENEKVSCVFGDRQNYNELNNSYKTFSNKNNPYVNTIMDGNDFFINMPKIKFIFSHLACLYRRELALKLNFYNVNIVSSDSQSIMKLYINHHIGYLPYFVGVWRAHNSNASYSRKIDETLKNLSKYHEAFDIAKKSNIFNSNDLDNWLRKSIIGNLSQDILYEFRSFSFKKTPIFIYKIFKYDFVISLKSFGEAIKKILNKVVK